MPSPCLADTSCVDLDVDNTGALKATIIRRPGGVNDANWTASPETSLPGDQLAQGNGLICTSTGLWAPPPGYSVTTFYDTPTPPVSLSGTNVGLTDLATATAAVTNPNPSVYVDVHFFAYITGRVNVVGTSSVSVYLKTSLGSLVNQFPATFIMHNSAATGNEDMSYTMLDLPTAQRIAPLGSITYTATLVYDKTGPVGGYVSGAVLRVKAVAIPVY